MSSRFQSVPGLRVGRSFFDLSYNKKLTCDFSYLYPVYEQEMVPGDTFKLGASCIVRTQPTQVPIMDSIVAYEHMFFVPYRLVDPDFVSFVTGGITGQVAASFPQWPWPEASTGTTGHPEPKAPGTLWDYFALPTDITGTDYRALSGVINPIRPIDYFRRGYYRTFIEYYEDETLTFNKWRAVDALLANGDFNDKFDWLGHEGSYMWNLQQRSWKKDYFTAALPSQQRGVALNFPMTGLLPLKGLEMPWPSRNIHSADYGQPSPIIPLQGYGGISATDHRSKPVIDAYTHTLVDDITGVSTGNTYWLRQRVASNPLYNAGMSINANLEGSWNADVQNNPAGVTIPNNYQFTFGIDSHDIAEYLQADMSAGASFDVSTLRSIVQFQKWQERNMRCGVRYTEFLRAHFGVCPRDETLQRVQYVGGCRFNINVSEVTQTSATGATGTPQGNLAGKGLGLNASYIGTYRAREYGFLLGLLSFMPTASYEDGVNRQFIKDTRFDFYSPEFAHLSEQAVYNCELRYNCGPTDRGTFGYQPVYEHMRYRPDVITSGFRLSKTDGLGTWHFGRHFAKNTLPLLNESFLKSGFNEPTGCKRFVFAPSEPTFLVNWRNHVSAVRPLPRDGTPGLVDHS